MMLAGRVETGLLISRVTAPRLQLALGFALDLRIQRWNHRHRFGEPKNMTGPVETESEFEIAHVLCTDIVGYSKLMIDQQTDLLRKLNDVVRATDQFRRADASGKLLRIPTGDGIDP
jgi:hypothetical protein